MWIKKNFTEIGQFYFPDLWVVIDQLPEFVEAQESKRHLFVEFTGSGFAGRAFKLAMR